MQIDDLASCFPDAVRQRGETCRRAGAVTIRHISPTSIRAVAIGTETYDVRIEVDDGNLLLSCSCPAFDKDGPCKHLWAAALVADERRMLAPLPSWITLAPYPPRPALDPTRVVLRPPPGSPLP